MSVYVYMYILSEDGWGYHDVHVTSMGRADAQLKIINKPFRVLEYILIDLSSYKEYFIHFKWR